VKRPLSLVALILGLCAFPASAILDTNNNGLSDLWESMCNDEELFPSTDFPYGPQDDPDGDGWTNEQEAVAGTNPFDPNPPDGLLRPDIVHIPELWEDQNNDNILELVTPEAVIISWTTIPGKQYTLLYSPDLVDWLPVPDETFIGNGSQVEYNFTLAEDSKIFWRVTIEDVDSDGDGLTDAEEYELGLNPYKAQTLLGLPDLWLATHFTSTLQAGGGTTLHPNSDPDGDGMSIMEEFLAGTDPNTPDGPAVRQWVTVNGEGGAQDVPVTRTGTLTIPAGQSATLIIAISSNEYPTYTGTPSEYDDLIEWDITLSEGPAIQNAVDVNDRHAAWETAEANGTSLPGLPGVAHYEVVRTINAPMDEDLTLEVSASVTNIGDAAYPSHIAIGLLPVEIVSRDKFLAGSIRIPDGWTGLELEFGGHEDLGRYGGFMQLGATKVFDSINDLLNSPEAEQPVDQKVWFVRDSNDPRKIYFRTCYNSLGTAELKLHLNLGGSAEPIVIEHELKAAPDFALIISYVDQWVKGDLFTDSGLGTTWLAFNTSELTGELANQARACLIPFFDVIDQVTGLTRLAMGLCDGSRTGFKDDLAFLQLIAGGVSTSAGWVVATASAEIDGWRNDPVMRVKELKTILGDLCEKTILPHLSSLGEQFTTWEGFKNIAWRTWNKVWELELMLRAVPLVSLQLVANGIFSWGEDFCTRMMEGAEKAAWDNTPWDSSPLFVEIEMNRNLAWYTFGYTFGYLGEQCLTAAISAGTVTLGKIIAKSGTVLISKLAPRAMGVLAIRLHFIKQALAGIDFADDGLRYAHEGMMSSAARQPTTPVIKEIPASLMENRMAAQGFDRATLNFKEWVKTAVPDGNVRKLIKTLAGRDVFSKRTSQLMHLLGDECDAVTMKNFMKAAEDRVIVVHPDGTVDEFFEGFFRAFEGNSSLANNLDDPMHSIATWSSGAKERAKHFLSGEDAGSLWRLDDPVFVDGVPQIPQNYWTRGVLGELDVFNRVYKKQGYTHAPSAEGYDIFAPKWVQVKTTANPSSSGNIEAMKKAIDKLVLESPEEATLKLHILKKPGTDSTALQTALEDYLIDKPYKNRFDPPLIEPYDIGPQ